MPTLPKAALKHVECRRWVASDSVSRHFTDDLRPECILGNCLKEGENQPT